MSKHVGEKCGKGADGDPDRRRVGWRPGRTDGHHHTMSEDRRIKMKKFTDGQRRATTIAHLSLWLTSVL